MKLKKILITITAILTGIISCKEEELDLQDPNVIVPNTFFQNSGELQSAVNGAYSFLQSQGMYGRVGFFSVRQPFTGEFRYRRITRGSQGIHGLYL